MNSIIKDYFEITGRPIATMTVAEYLEFRKYTGEVVTVPSESIKPVEKPAVIKNTNQATDKVNTKPVMQKNIAPQPAKLTETALDMLKSVSG